MFVAVRKIALRILCERSEIAGFNVHLENLLLLHILAEMSPIIERQVLVARRIAAGRRGLGLEFGTSAAVARSENGS